MNFLYFPLSPEELRLQRNADAYALLSPCGPAEGRGHGRAGSTASSSSSAACRPASATSAGSAATTTAPSSSSEAAPAATSAYIDDKREFGVTRVRGHKIGLGMTLLKRPAGL